MTWVLAILGKLAGKLSGPVLGYLIVAVAIAWAGSLGALWLRMDAEADHAFEAGKLTASVELREAAYRALEKAVADASKVQSEIAERNRADSDRLHSALGRATATLTNASTELSAYARANPLPADCRADPVRMRHVNTGR